MTLPLKVDDINTVDEGLRSYYVEKNGSFHLDVSGLEDTGGLKSALDKERSSRSALEKQTKAWTAIGKTPDEITEILKGLEEQEQQKAEKAGEWDKLKAQMNEANTKALADKDAIIANMQKTIEKKLITAEATSAITSAKGSTDLLLPIVERSVRVVEDNGDYRAVVVDAKGDPRINAKGENLSISDLVDEMKQSEKFGRAFEGSGQSGSGKLPNSNGGGTTLKRSQMTAKEVSEFVTKNGQEAYLKLPK